MVGLAALIAFGGIKRVTRATDAMVPVMAVVYVGTVPNTELYNEIRLDNGFLTTDENMQTEIPGVYAVGDIRVKQVRQVSTAVADGTIAAIHAAR